MIAAIARLLSVAAALGLTGCAAYGPPLPGETIRRNITYAAPSGRALHLDLYLPALPRPAPVIIWLHGGGWKYGYKGYNLQLRKLTQFGFAVAAVEYRRTGEAVYPAALDDCRAAVEWVRTHGAAYGLDPRRIGLSGESAGGHLAAYTATLEKRPRIRAVMVMYPPTDLLALGQRYERYPGTSLVEQFLGGPLRHIRALAIAASPVTHVAPGVPPFLIFHGGKDWLVPLEQSVALHRRLQAAGVASTLEIVPGKDHAFSLTDSQLRETARFFKKHLSPPP